MTRLMAKQKITPRKKQSLHIKSPAEIHSQPSQRKVKRSRSLSRRRLKRAESVPTSLNLPSSKAEKSSGDPVSSAKTGLLEKGRAAIEKSRRGMTVLSLSTFKDKRLWAALGAAAAVTASLAALAFVSRPEPPQIAFPRDPVLSAHLLDYASVAGDFEGQGSGDMLPVASPYLPAVSLDTYVIQRGDTLSAIAKQHGLSVGTLIGYNSITDVYTIIPGTELKIPDIDGVPYQVKTGDSLSSIAEAYGIGINDLLDANDLASTEILPGESLFIPGGKISDYDYKKAVGTLFVYPTSGRFTSGFGYRSDPFTGVRRFHYAIDLANRIGTPIRASQAGVVISVLDRPTGYGKSIILRHPNGYQTLYAHMSEFSVRQGQRVSQGQVIGRMGNTGRSTGSHLHFSIYKNNVPVDPLNYLHQ